MQTAMQTDVVTGAFGYSGAAIARELRAAGRQVAGHGEELGRSYANELTRHYR
jgi:NAD(P)-dependent dehydrogenase (short-subunit alcohol dehydrogenase family)